MWKHLRSICSKPLKWWRKSLPNFSSMEAKIMADVVQSASYSMCGMMALVLFYKVLLHVELKLRIINCLLGDKHIGVFIIYELEPKPTEAAETTGFFLLCFIPLNDPSVCPGDEHINTITQCLENLGLRREDILFIAAEDDTNVNPFIAMKLEIKFLALREEKRHQRGETHQNSFFNLDWIPSTTCDTQRLFSKCKYVHPEFRRALTPGTFEGLLFNRVNRNWWDINDVCDVVHRSIA